MNPVWMDGCKDGCMDAWIHGWMHGWTPFVHMDGWMNVLMDRCVFVTLRVSGLNRNMAQTGLIASKLGCLFFLVTALVDHCPRLLLRLAVLGCMRGEAILTQADTQSQKRKIDT
jgi:hypothetical protein